MQKRYLVASAAMLIGAVLSEPVASQSYAIDRGSWRIAGSARAFGEKYEGNDTRQFVIEVLPRVGYFVFKGLSVDANLRFIRFTRGGNTGIEWGVGPGATYFVGGAGWRVFPFASFRTLFRFGEWVDKSSWLVGGGVVCMLVPHVGITGELSYQYTWHEVDNSGQGYGSEVYGFQIGVAAFVF